METVFLDLYPADGGRSNGLYVEVRGDRVGKITGDGSRNLVDKILHTFKRDTVIYVDISWYGSCLADELSRWFDVRRTFPRRLRRLE